MIVNLAAQWDMYKAKILISLGVVLLLVASHLGAYFYGKAVQRTEHVQDMVKVLEGELKGAKTEGRKNAVRAEKTGADVARMEAELAKTKGELDEAINENKRNANCDLTDAELNGLQAVRDSYR